MGLPNFMAWKGVLGLCSISRMEDGMGCIFLQVPPGLWGVLGKRHH